MHILWGILEKVEKACNFTQIKKRQTPRKEK